MAASRKTTGKKVAARNSTPARATTKKATPKKAAARKVEPAAAGNPGGIGDAAVKKATGKTWPQWLKALDAAGCRAMTHREIVTVVREAHGLGPWWQQMIAVGYERARGLREKHQVAGGFTATATRTIEAPVQTLFDAWFDPKRRRGWLPDPDIDVRTVRPPKSIRAVWVDGASRLDVQFAVRGASRATVSVAHEKLKEARAVTRMKAYWREALVELKARLEG